MKNSEIGNAVPMDACPVYQTLDIVGRKWAFLVIRDLLDGKSHFNEFLSATPALTPAVLSARLSELEAAGIIERSVANAKPARVTYRLTARGRKIRPVVNAMRAFGKMYCKN